MSLIYSILKSASNAYSVLGKFLLQNSNQLRIAAGLIIIIFSLQLLGIINIKFLNYEKKYYTHKSTKPLFKPCIVVL